MTVLSNTDVLHSEYLTAVCMQVHNKCYSIVVAVRGGWKEVINYPKFR